MNEENKKYTVYMHIAPNEKKYIGITCQKPEERWKKDGRGYFYQSNSHFERAILKYGWDNFEHKILVEGLDESEAKQMEKELITKYNTNNPEFGYNKTGGGDGFLGVQRFGKDNFFYGKHHSKQTKEIIQKALGHEVYQFDFDLNLIKLYPSIKAASKESGIHESQIEGCVHQKTGYKSAGGYLWILKKDLSELKLNEIKSGLQHEKLPKPICQYDLQMNFVAEYPSIGEASRKTKIKASCISRASSNKAKTAGKSIGVSRPAIASACKSKTHISKGYVWRFEEEVEHE